MPFSEATLNACVTPAPPGVTDVTFAIELPPQIRIRVLNVTGIEYAARKTAITPRLATQARNDGRKTRQHVRPRLGEDGSALLGVLPPDDDAMPEPAYDQEEEEPSAEEHDRRRPGCSCTNANLMSNKPADRKKR